MLAVGLMSGTSLDGIDAALCEISGSKLGTKITLLKFNTYPYDTLTRNEIMEACDPTKGNIVSICSLNFKLGYAFATAVKDICREANLRVSDLDFVASHGQTLYHIPKNTETLYKSTLQVGEPSIIAYQLNVDVIADFRVMDMAANGEGAPLVPYSEYVLYQSKTEHIALQNIGGISNVTMLYANSTMDDILAFDTGPGNMMIDEACFQLFQKKYDDGGKLASKGKIHEPLLCELLSHPYMDENPPKSTGREIFGRSFVKALLKKYKNIWKEDIITTFTAYTAKSIALNYRRYIFSKGIPDEIIVAGGGIHNKTLMRMLKEELPECNVITQESIGYNSDAKEAMAFVILGNETLQCNTNNVKRATGADNSVVLGKIIRKPRSI